MAAQRHTRVKRADKLKYLVGETSLLYLRPSYSCCSSCSSSSSSDASSLPDGKRTAAYSLCSGARGGGGGGETTTTKRKQATTSCRSRVALRRRANRSPGRVPVVSTQVEQRRLEENRPVRDVPAESVRESAQICVDEKPGRVARMANLKREKGNVSMVMRRRNAKAVKTTMQSARHKACSVSERARREAEREEQTGASQAE